MDALAQLSKRKENISKVFCSWKSIRLTTLMNKRDSLRSALEQRGFGAMSPNVGTEISSFDLLTEVLANAMDWAVCTGFADRPAIQFLHLYIQVLLTCGQPAEQLREGAPNLESNQGPPDLHSAVTTFRNHFLPQLTLTFSPPFSTLAVRYMFDTVFTHFHLYQIMLCNSAEMQTEDISLEIETVATKPLPLSQGVTEKEWKLQERLKSLESDHGSRISTLRRSLPSEQGANEVMTFPLATEGKSTLSIGAVSRIVKSASSETLHQLSALASHDVDILKEQVDYKSAVVQAMIDSKK